MSEEKTKALAFGSVAALVIILFLLGRKGAITFVEEAPFTIGPITVPGISIPVVRYDVGGMNIGPGGNVTIPSLNLPNGKPLYGSAGSCGCAGSYDVVRAPTKYSPATNLVFNEGNRGPNIFVYPVVKPRSSLSVIPR